MHELKIKAKCVLDADGRLDQIKAALERKLEDFGPTPAHDKEVVIVGSGPSVKKQWKKIGRLKDKGCMVLAIKGAHDFLIKKGIIPHAALAVDPMDHIWKCFQKKLPSGELQRPVYLIASQCHASTFDYLANQRVILWHLLATSSAKFLDGKLQVGGGSTSGSRGCVLAWMMGFRTFHLFGFDSCLEGDGTSKLRKITGERYGGDDQKILELVCEGKTFYADPAMAAQANEIQDVFAMLEGSRFKAYGKGLVQTIVAANAANKWKGYYAVSDEFGESRIPAVRPEDAQHIKDALRFASTGVFRGYDYYDSPGGEVLAESG